MTQYLLRVDAVNLGSFVLDTEDISTIRGGSFILLDAVTDLVEAIPDLTEITATASQGLFSFDDGDDDKCPANLRRKALERLEKITGGHATFVAATTPYKENDDFQQTLARLEADIHRQQMRRPTVRVPIWETTVDGGPPRKECYLDGWRPGTEMLKDRALEHNLISVSVAQRRQKGQKLRHALFGEILGKGYEDVYCTSTLEELASDPSQGGLDGRMALFYVDGNSFGKTRRHTCLSPDLRKSFDETIQEARSKFLQELLDAARTDEGFQHDQDLRIELLLWGGDEFMVIVPAWRGLETVQMFYKSMAKLEFNSAPLSHRGTLIFCHHNAPIVPLRNLAEAMLKRTKEDLNDRAGAESSTPCEDVSLLSNHGRGDGIHYLNLESFDMLGGHLDDFVSRHYRGLCGKPLEYRELLVMASDLDELGEHLSTIRQNLPHSVVIQVIREMLKDRRLELLADCVDPEQPLEAQAVEVMEEVTSRALEVLPRAQYEPTQKAIATLTEERPHRWYVINDLWDYVIEGGTP